MKKIIAVFLIFVLLALLSACGVTKVDVSSVTSGAAEPSSQASYAVNYTEEETRAMSNYMLGGRFLHSGKLLYGSRHDEQGMPYLCRMKFSSGGSGMYVRETEPIEFGVDAHYLTLYEDQLYYLREDLAAENSSIVRVPAAFGSAERPEVLFSGPCDFLSFCGGRFYFTDAACHLLSMNPDGSDVRTELADKEIYYPYLLTQDILLYQDDAAGESLRMRFLPTGFEIGVSDGPVYSFILSGGELYLLRGEEDGNMCRLCRTDLNSFLGTFEPQSRPDASFVFRVEEAEACMGPLFSLNGSHINASNYRSFELSSWHLTADDAWEKGYTAACQYVSGDFEIFYDYNSEGLITKMLFYEPSLKRPGYIELYNFSKS